MRLKDNIQTESNVIANGGDSTKWNVAYTHSQTTHDKNLVGLSNVDNTADANKSVNYANTAYAANRLNVFAGNEVVIGDGYNAGSELYINYRGGNFGSYRFCNGQSTGSLVSLKANNFIVGDAGYNVWHAGNLTPTRINGNFVANGTGFYFASDSSHYSPSENIPTVMIRTDDAHTGINGTLSGLVLYNGNGGQNTGSNLTFASRESNGSGNDVALSGIFGWKISAGNANGWSAGGLKLWVKNYGTLVDALTIDNYGTVSTVGEIYANSNSKVWHSGNFNPDTKAEASHSHSNLPNKLTIGNVLQLGNEESIATSSNRGIYFHSGESTDYAIYKPSGSWTQPLHIGFYTGIKIGASSDYGGTKFYSAPSMGAELMSVGNGDGNVRIANDIYVGSAGRWMSNTAPASHTHDYATHRGEGTNFVDYSRYVYNNGAYSGSGWVEPSDLGVRYAGTAGNAYQVSTTVGAGALSPLVSATIGDNDFFRIAAGGSSNGGYVEIATGDDATEPIYVRQYYGVFSSVARTATLLDESGNTRFPNTVYAGAVTASGEVTAYSDKRLKEDIKPLKVRGELNPVTYTKDGKASIGFVAQEVKEVYPELVVGDESKEMLSLNYQQLTAVLYAEILELKERIKKLEGGK